MFVAFPWYDLPGVEWANNCLWRQLRTALTGVGAADLPVTLDRTSAAGGGWRRADLLISQMCGLDLAFEPQVVPLLTPEFDLPDCPPGHYYSHIVIRSGAVLPASPCAAVNSPRSHSGCTALLATLTPGRMLFTGSHCASLQALHDGRADVAAIDAITWNILAHSQPARLAGLIRTTRTATQPAPPWVTRRNHPLLGTLRAALRTTLTHPQTRTARGALHLLGALALPDDAYAPLTALAQHQQTNSVFARTLTQSFRRSPQLPR